jgi:hypothetical protein
MREPRHQRHRRTPVFWGAVCLLALLAAVVLAAYAASTPNGAQPFLGYWRLPETEVGGAVLLHIAADGDAISVTGPGYYFGDNDGTGPLTHEARLEGDRLVALGNGTAPDSAAVSFTSAAEGRLAMFMRSYVECGGHNPIELQRPRGSDHELAAEMDRQTDVEMSLRTLSAGVLAWTRAHHGTMPWSRDVRPGTAFARATVVRAAMGDWPLNPFTGQAMHPGDGPGDYRYESDRHKAYRLQANVADTDAAYASVYLIKYP